MSLVLEYGYIYVNKRYDIDIVVKSFWERKRVFIQNTFHVRKTASNI